jgi:hypothetical protein
MQPDTEAFRSRESAEPGNFETPATDRAANPDASAAAEHGRVDYEEINTHGSER